ncbi:MAG: hypothetical protein HC859_06195 [Bacteroidia bacterium]|nr:hypothetical protein [Bacteroidia bacterium]
MKIQLVFCFLLAATYASAQNTLLPGHEFYLKQMGDAKDSVYKEAMSHYDQFIAKYPDSVRARLEQCRLMQHAYYDAYEEYNPLEEEAEACARNLVKDFADVPEVRLYAMDYIYGDSAITYLQDLEKLAREQPARWQHHLWNVYQLMAQRQEYDDNNLEVLHYASMAMEENDTLDLTIQKARAEQALGRNNDAVETLLSKMDSSQAGYYYNQKGKMLLELGEPERALEILKMASRDTSNWQDLESLAQAMIDNGVPEAARDYLLKNRDRNTWNKTPSLIKLLEYDLKYKRDSAGASYDRYVNDNFWDDGMGVYRLRVLVADPGHHWTWSDAGRLLVLLASVVCILLLPYLWILPIHYIGTWLRSRGRQFELSPFRWTMADFWMASSLWLMASLIAGLFFNYRGMMSYFDDSISLDTVLPVNTISANLFLCFTLACLAVTYWGLCGSLIGR